MKIMTAMYTVRKGGSYDRFIMMLEAFLERDCDSAVSFFDTDSD